MLLRSQTIERTVKVLSEDHENPQWGKPYVDPDTGVLYDNRTLIDFVPNVFLVRQFTIYCDYDQADQVHFAIKAPGSPPLYADSKLASKDKGFLVGPHRLAFGSFDQKFRSVYAYSLLDVVFKSYVDVPIEVQFIAEIEFVKNT